MNGTENKALYIAEQCRKAGITLAGAAGILANIEAESAFKSTNLQDVYEVSLGMNDAQYTAAVDSGAYTRFVGDDAGYGICQWTASDRKDGMMKFHRARGASIGDFRTQVDWMLTEIKQYAYAWRTCTTSDNPYECGYAVCRYYEIPANTEQQAKGRGGNSQKWYDFLAAAMKSGTESTITEEPAPQANTESLVTDGDGVPQNWPPRTIDAHCSGWPEVKLLQAVLSCRGYNALIDGLWTDELTKKVKAFQTAQRLQPVDGVVGPGTWAALGLSETIFKK
ncbi:MAG: peptidoglycan-binding protein [Oscillospiraceae bacterium]|nr:peptidoglycan-binding protein [Oscillospiraceae bacterium]